MLDDLPGMTLPYRRPNTLHNSPQSDVNIQMSDKEMAS